jgi:hypothetical protein
MSIQKIQTPRGEVVIVDTPTLHAELIWNPGFAPRWQEKFETAQKFVESEVIRLSEPYVPFLTGMLVKSGILGTKLGEGVVAWIAPYARYQYYGKVMVGPAPRKVTDQDLQYHGGGLRGSFWFERMKQNHMEEINSGTQKMFGGGA